jgi:hypothetical protein
MHHKPQIGAFQTALLWHISLVGKKIEVRSLVPSLASLFLRTEGFAFVSGKFQIPP